MRSKGSASELKAVRRRAVQMVLGGRTEAALAVALDIHSVTVAKWMARHRAAGADGLAAKPTPGRPRFLTPEQDPASALEPVQTAVSNETETIPLLTCEISRT